MPPKEDIRADLRRRTRRTNGDNHVAQTLACCIRCGFAGRGCFGADFGIGLGWTPRRLARWRLAWWWAWRLGLARRTTLLCRRCRLWLLLRAPTGAHALGTPLACDQSLLLTAIGGSEVKETPAKLPGLPASNQSHDFNSIFTRNPATGRSCRNNLRRRDLVKQGIAQLKRRGTRYEQPDYRAL